jgi:glycogen(starch) synthase
LKLCIFSRTFYPALGGLERISQILATQATVYGHDVIVITDTEALSDADDERFPFKIIRTKQYWRRVEGFKQADAVLFMNVSLHGLLAASTARVPIVFSHHGIYRGRGFIGQSFELIKRNLTRFYRNISVSQFVARHLPSAYDSSVFMQPAPPERSRDFVFCGRLVSDKGADLCVRALFRVIECLGDATLTIIGGGSERQVLQQLVGDLGISKNVLFTGALSGGELVAELQKHTCMVVPSLCEEAFGIVALEGIACCDTVIVTRRGALPEVVGGCGMVIEPTDDAMTEAMMSVVMARRAGKALPGQPTDEIRKTHLVQHTPEAITRKYLDVVAQVMVGHFK